MADPQNHDPDQIGKTGGRPRGGAGLTKLLGKALGKGWQRPVKAGDRAAGRGTGRGFRQRVIVKALVVRHGPRRRAAGRSGKGGGASKSGASLARHVRYLGRDGTSEQGDRGQFYDRAQDGLDAAQLTKAWHDDRHHFRLIVSPENGGELPDLTAYVREVMARVETDLRRLPSERVEWLAINHFNTDNPHAHVLICGAWGRVSERAAEPSGERRPEAADGSRRVLVLPRAYVSHGIRGRAEEVATEILGERSLEEVRHAREQEVTAERWTGLDRAIARQAQRQQVVAAHPDGLQIDVSPARLPGVSGHERGLIVRRLQTLQRYGLARPERSSRWRVAADFRERLIALGARRDVIQRLYGKHGHEASQVVPFGLAERLSGRAAKSIQGAVIDHGIVDELGLDRYLVVRDEKGGRHYAAVRDGRAYEQVQTGATVVIGASASERRTAADELARVAGRHADGAYTRERHATDLEGRSDLPDAERSDLLSRTARLAAMLAGRPGTGVERQGQDGRGETFQIDRAALERLVTRESRRATTDVRVLAGGRPAERSTDRPPARPSAPPLDIGRPVRRGREREGRDELERG